VLQGVSQDFRLALRGLFATRVVSAVAVLSLALGIGANTAIFSLANSVLFRTLPVFEPWRLVTVSSEFAINLGYKAGAGWSYRMWERLRERPELFDGALAWSGARLNLNRGGEAQQVTALYVSGEFFGTLGVPALHGRVFKSSDDTRGGGAEGPVAVISYGLWQRRFGGAPNVIGTPIVVEGVPLTIVGVTPRGFLGLEVGQEFDLAVPLGTEPLIRGNRGSGIMQERSYPLIVLLRLKHGQSLQTATATIRGIQAELVPANAPPFVKQPIVLAPAAEGTSLPNAGAGGLRQRFERPLMTLLAVVAFVLLIACVNIANLLLARATARRHELSVRIALGASRWRLARQLLVESLVLATAGASVGVLFAAWASRALVAQLSTSVSRVVLDLSLDWPVAVFTAALTIATAFLFGIAPAFRATRLAAMDALKAQGRRAAGGGTGHLSSALVVVQVALSLVLVVAAGLLVRTFERLAFVPLGFDADRVLVVNVDTTRARTDPASRLAFFDRLARAVAAVPGVARASASTWTPLSGGGALLGVDVPGTPQATERGVVANFVSSGWFATYGTPFRAGRDIDDRDTATALPVIVVNEAFVRRFFAGRSAVGESVSLSGPKKTMTVVGVVGDAVFRSGRMIPGVASLALRDGVPPMIYIPLAQSAGVAPPSFSTTFSLSVRAAGGSPATLAPAVATALTAIDPDVAFTFRPLDDYVDASLSQERMVAALSGFFGLLGLLLGGLGLYGITSYSVALRRTEIGIRLALGAAPGGVMRLVLSRVALLVGAGVVVGAVASLWASKFVAALLFGLDARDPTTFAAAGVVLAVVGGVAGWLPARRASHTDPAIVLRSE
jgi:putative ABC transport system permease protein